MSFYKFLLLYLHSQILPLNPLLMLRFLPLVALLLFALTSHAQPGSGGPTPTGVPIDGGISVLLAGGAAYAVRRLRKRRA
ncbi:PID-CTERM protein-sorting domain-containing protein [Hymenobacter bucti]|uniref:PID-CTERM protein-sorting domain-containing protein n=1 Tax=Hymenobacter bucti TaxID=1844114 RepID=A0ABW4QWR4_9BACT